MRGVSTCAPVRWRFVAGDPWGEPEPFSSDSLDLSSLLSRLRVISPTVPARLWSGMPHPETDPPFAPWLLTEGPRRSPLQPSAQRRGFWEVAEKAFHRSITEQRRALISLRLRPPGTRLVRLRSPPGGECFLSRLQKGLCKRAKSAQHNSIGRGF